ncbi:hypothetical protein Dda_4694 [Drechslerella dactyloides]|uniref:Uncharacterized protein n=1 Tax=Drechslerella dactyloides TaxID=74499 RepID=A0AAD6NKU9_DREDA|nr:hypothetical protein Dda_4694 [Drechslerella dactyloides]
MDMENTYPTHYDEDAHGEPETEQAELPAASHKENQSNSGIAVEDQDPTEEDGSTSANSMNVDGEVKTGNDDVDGATTSDPAQGTKKGQKGQRGRGGRSRGGRKSGGRKSGGTAKQPPAKKRKVIHENDNGDENKENEGPNEGPNEDTNEGTNVETKKEPQDDSNPKPRGKGRAKGSEPTEAWTNVLDKGLLDIIKRRTNNELVSVPWKDVYADFTEAYPESKKSLKAVQMRWFQFVKHSAVELTEQQITQFKQAVKDINGSEKNAAIAWRYQQISGEPLNKGTVANLLKSLSLKINVEAKNHSQGWSENILKYIETYAAAFHAFFKPTALLTHPAKPKTPSLSVLNPGTFNAANGNTISASEATILSSISSSCFFIVFTTPFAASATEICEVGIGESGGVGGISCVAVTI